MSLHLTDITLTYPDGDARLTALDRVDLHVEKGTMTAVIGPSGSGKSSLLAVAATLITPDSGRVVIDGTPTADMTRKELTTLRRNKIGTVFQQPNLVPSLTAIEQLQVIAHLGGHSPRGAEVSALALLDAVGLGDHSHKRPHQLSGGQRQRINIARALMSNPAVLLIDEPTSALDHERGAAILDLIGTLTRTNGTATVVVTHDYAHLSDMDGVVEIEDGRLLVDASSVRGGELSEPAHRPHSRAGR